VFELGEYEFELSREPKTIIDAGANIGMTSIFFALKYPSAQIVAIEPEKRNFELLCENLRPYERVSPMRAAIWSESEDVNIVDPGLGDWGFQTRPGNNDRATQSTEKVRGLTIDAVMDEFGFERVDILKMDIEGAEKEVFENAGAWLDKVGVLIVELHDGEKVGCSRSFYNATNGFDKEWKTGESVYLVNTNLISASPK
jgi:FkbM family methyltransferase